MYKIISKRHESGASKRLKKQTLESENKKLSDTASKFFKKTADSGLVLKNDVATEKEESEGQINNEAGNIQEIQPDVNLKDETEHQAEKNTDDKQCSLSELTEEYDKSDPSAWPVPVSVTQRKHLLEQGPIQKVLSTYPDRNNYKFNNKCFSRTKENGEVLPRDWLLYSMSTNSLYCFCCCLFENSLSTPWNNYGSKGNGFTDFNHKARGITQHESSSSHFNCVQLWKLYLKSLSDEKSFSTIGETQYIKEASLWVKIFRGILDAIIFLAKNNLAFRGDSSSIADRSCGNFLNLIKLLAKYYSPLTDHVNRLKKNDVSYLSPKIQNEFINICGNEIRKKIVENIRKRKYYSIIFDSTPDTAHLEQVSQVIRSVYCSKSECYVQENFVEFISNSEKTGESLANLILDKLNEDGLKIKNCRGQSYDNASNMSGIYKGVQARIKEKNSAAHYVPCVNHSLNLVGSNAVEAILPARLILGSIQSIYNFFSGSPARWEVLKSKLKMTLIGYSQTRWSSKYNAVSALSIQYNDVIECLIELTDHTKFTAVTNTEANNHLDTMLTYKFLLGVTIWENVLYRLEVANLSIQSPDTDVSKVEKVLEGLLIHFKEYRQTGFLLANEKAKVISEEIGIDYMSGFNDVRSTRGRKRKRLGELCEDAQLSNIKTFEVNFFNELVDRIISEMKSRFMEVRQLSETFGFLFGEGLMKLSIAEKETKVKALCKKYPEDFNEHEFLIEINRMKSTLIPFTPKEKNLNESKPLHILKMLYKNKLDSSLPNVETALRIFLTLPVNVASNERSFTKLKLIKNYLRSSMGQERLSNLAIISIEQDVLESIDFDRIIQEFANAKVRKVNIEL